MAPTSKSYHLFVWSRELRGLSSIRSIPQMLPNFFCEGPCSKYFKICRPHSLCSNYFMLQYEASCLLFSCEVMSNSLWCHGLQHTRLLFHSLSPRVPSNSYPLSQWCYLTISSSAAPISFCLQSFPASGSFAMSKLFYTCFIFLIVATWARLTPIFPNTIVTHYCILFSAPISVGMEN